MATATAVAGAGRTVSEPLPRSTRVREWVTTGLVWLCRIGVVALPLYLWERAAAQGLVELFIFSQPSRIYAQLQEWLRDGTILNELWFTLITAFSGYLLGLLIGTALAVLLYQFTVVGEALMPFMTMLNAIPRIAFAPLLIGWLGFGISSNVALVVLVTLIINFFAVYGGLTSIDEDHLRWSTALGANRRQMWTAVRFPSIVRWVLSALRISIGLALSAAIVSEFVGGARGIGHLVSSSTNLFRSAGVYAGMAVVIVVVGAIDALLRQGEKRLTHWIGQ